MDREKLIKERKEACAWYYKKDCMATSGQWGQYPCDGDCKWIKDYEKELDGNENI